jgi:rhomboid family GlyGly-CTERM serine protease
MSRQESSPRVGQVIDLPHIGNLLHVGVACPWTLGLCAAMLLANVGLLPHAAEAGRSLIGWLEFDRQAILQGQLWRLITGNLVHWSVEHFLLDVGPFLIVGLLYERSLRRQYPWFLLGSALAIGASVLLFLPEVETYRGLSGVDSGQFALAVCVELGLARREPRRWVWLAPAAAIFVAKIFWESTTGRMFFGTESLGDIGVPIALAHVAGTAAAILLSIRLPSAVHCQLGARTSSRSIPWIKPHRIRPR